MPKKYKYTKTFTFEGKRYVVRADTEKDCLMKMALRLRDLEEGRVLISGNMSVREWSERAIEVYKSNVVDKSKEDFQRRVEKHILSQIGSFPLKSIKAVQCQEILNKQSGMSFSHVQKVSQALKFIFRTAKENQLILSDPTENIVLPDSVKGSRRALTKYETEHFLKVCAEDPRFIFFEFMYYCGCRPGEVVNLIRKDIELVDGEHMLHIRGTKTANSDRYVPLNRILFDRVKNYTPFELLCQNGANSKHTKSSYDRMVAALKRAMNISMGCKTYRNALIPPYPLAADFVPYCLRHTYCTNLAKAGVDIRIAQKLMGHANIAVTAEIYTHVDMDDIKKAAALLRNVNL